MGYMEIDVIFPEIIVPINNLEEILPKKEQIQKLIKKLTTSKETHRRVIRLSIEGDRSHGYKVHGYSVDDWGKDDLFLGNQYLKVKELD